MRTTHTFARLQLTSKMNNFQTVSQVTCCRYSAAQFPVWIVSDCRRETDLRCFTELMETSGSLLRYFTELWGDRVRSLRIEAGEDVRRQRSLQP